MNIEQPKLLKHIFSFLIICELIFTPVSICEKFHDYVKKQGKQYHDIQSNSCCCEEDDQCPIDSGSEKSHADNNCCCAFSDSVPNIVTNTDIQTILVQNPYFSNEFQFKPLQRNQTIFHPPK